MTREELLLELRDISPPVEPAWWLLPPGYLLIFIVLVAGCVLIGYWLRRRRRGRLLMLARSGLREINASFAQNGDTYRLSLRLSRWLKQVTMLAYPERRAQGLTGSEWLLVLDEILGDDGFSVGPGRVFGDAIYRRRVEFDAAQLLDLCENWLQAVEPRLLRRGTD